MAAELKQFMLSRESNLPIVREGHYVFTCVDTNEEIWVTIDSVDLNQESQDIVQDNITYRLIIGPYTELSLAESIDEDETYVNGDASFLAEAEDSKDKTFWNDSQTKLLITLYKEHRPKVGKSIKLKTKKKMWEFIADELKKKGHTFTIVQVINKWKTLEQRFKRKTTNNKKTGRSRETCPYEKDLEDVFTKQANFFPEVLLSSKSTITKSDLLQQHGVCDPQEKELPREASSPMTDDVDSSSRDSVGAIPKQQKSGRSLAKEVETLRQHWDEHNDKKEEKRSERHAEKLELIRKRNDLLSERNAERKRTNDLMEEYLAYLKTQK